MLGFINYKTAIAWILIRTKSCSLRTSFKGRIQRETTSVMSKRDCCTQKQKEIIKVNPMNYEFPFENLVFEGGGSKGIAYCGAVRVLEEFRIYPQIKRFSGASTGAIGAALLAVGYNSYELEEFLEIDFSHFFFDAFMGKLSLLPNLISSYGWNPGNRFYQWLGETIAKKTNKPDITFSELYNSKKVELCIIVTNLNHMVEEYCHPKTTPDMPIRLAVRMSISIPGIFQAMTHTDKGETNTYVDGGLICNYPIHCFDGWWLSMKSGDSFLERLQPLNELPTLLAKKSRFGTFNDKTIGFLLYEESERDIYRYNLEDRVGSELPKVAIDTKLYKSKAKKREGQGETEKEHKHTTEAVDAFLKVLNRSNLDRDHVISRTELESAFEDSEFTPAQRKILFGEDMSIDEVFRTLDVNRNGQIQYHELVHFIQKKGILLQQRFLGYQRKDIDGVLSFFTLLQNTLCANVKRIFVEGQDLERTVGINTGHVGMTDFSMEKADKDFAVEQGRRSTVSFLKYYIVSNPDKVKERISTDNMHRIRTN